MQQPPRQTLIYIETGNKRTFACAVEWPGWCRSGRDEASAISALLNYAPRYARMLEGTEFKFEPASSSSTFNVKERVEGNATTDFGAPAAIASEDSAPLSDAEVERSQAILTACWKSFDAAAGRARGKDLQRGPRGGGRDLQQIIQHVDSAELAYLSRLGVRPPSGTQNDDSKTERQAVLNAVAETAKVKEPATGPRGGKRWPVRYFVRRVAWHILDHAWEIEDRTTA